MSASLGLVIAAAVMAPIYVLGGLVLTYAPEWIHDSWGAYFPTTSPSVAGLLTLVTLVVAVLLIGAVVGSFALAVRTGFLSLEWI